MITFCETGVHPLVEVKVSVTVPAAVSAALGEYDAFKVDADGEKVPLPLVVHTPVPVLEVAESKTEALFAHTTWSGPVVIVGIGANRMFIVSVTAKQLPLPVDVRIRTTLPKVVSAALGT
jgi:hypothetical protein